MSSSSLESRSVRPASRKIGTVGAFDDHDRSLPALLLTKTVFAGAARVLSATRIPMIATALVAAALASQPLEAAPIFQGLGSPDGYHSSEARAIAANGTTVVGDAYDVNGQKQAVVWNGSFNGAILETRFAYSSALGVSGDGTRITGFVSNGSSASQAVLWSGGGQNWEYTSIPTMANARAISESGSFVATLDEQSRQAARWREQNEHILLGDLPGGQTSSMPEDISADGSVVVGYGTAGDDTHAFRWTEADGLIDLGDLPGGESYSAA